MYWRMATYSAHHANFERLIENRGVPHEPNWITGDLLGYDTTVEEPLVTTSESGQRLVDEPLQQSDLLRPFYMDIAMYGLVYAYKKYGLRMSPIGGVPDDAVTEEKTKHPKDVVIVGAGIAGLVAAHELKRAGHRVKIVEATERIGGRIKTYDHKNGDFKKGLYVDGEFCNLPVPGLPLSHNPLKHFCTLASVGLYNYYAQKVLNQACTLHAWACSVSHRHMMF